MGYVEGVGVLVTFEKQPKAPQNFSYDVNVPTDFF